MDLMTAMTHRRTGKVFTGLPIARGVVEQLMAAAVLAPNHRLTQPWRFAAIDADGVARLVAFVQTPSVRQAVEARKISAICERLGKCGAIVQVTCVRSTDLEVLREDLAATAAAVQNVLLAATAQHLGSFWSTSPLMSHPEVQRWFGSNPEREAHVATLWLGHPGDQPPVPQRRPLTDVLHWVEA
jgi:nitroreductase